MGRRKKGKKKKKKVEKRGKKGRRIRRRGGHEDSAFVLILIRRREKKKQYQVQKEDRKAINIELIFQGKMQHWEERRIFLKKLVFNAPEKKIQWSGLLEVKAALEDSGMRRKRGARLGE